MKRSAGSHGSLPNCETTLKDTSPPALKLERSAGLGRINLKDDCLYGLSGDECIDGVSFSTCRRPLRL
eukprot:15098064-Heterocapsa_arctica.AAC.1